MTRWWADTLFKRLFLLMWFGLVASHLLAFVVTVQVHAPPEGAVPRLRGLPTVPALPPMGVLPDGLARRGAGPEGVASGGNSSEGMPRGGNSSEGMPRGGLPATALAMDFGIRFLAIGVVAWFGARWLSGPIRRLATASETLGNAIGRRQRTAPLDERHGTLEVRQTAQVFNTMAQRLHAQFDAQRLLMAAISHDLRTPLARLRLRLETMPAQPQIERCIDDVNEMNALIGSVLEMMREQHAGGTPERVDIGALAQALVDDLAEQGRPAQIEHAPSAIVLAQPAALNRVLGNLIGNALQHGGNARVSIEPRPGEVQVLVDDDGPGIPAHQLQAAFEPFERLDAARRRGDESGKGAGSGLGLYIARDLAQRHGGSLTLANRAEGGLRAALVWPAA